VGVGAVEVNPQQLFLTLAITTVSNLIKAEAVLIHHAAPAQSRFGSRAADRRALITTARHSEAAGLGTKRDTG
jgi:hypothetical protein